MNERSQRLSRRKFLLSVGAGGAATAAAVVGTKKLNSTSTPASAKGKRATVGYHETEHVNNYYRTAKV
jgi:nitrous oxide reductase